MNMFRWTAGVGLSLLCTMAANAQQAPTAAVGTGVPAAAQTGQASPPRCDANCVRENTSRAADACAPRIEAQSPHDFDWIARPNPGIFQQADPSSPSDSIVRYRGDSVRFMTADKSWTRVSYECGYDVSTQTVSYVHVRSGRLDQPLAPPAAQSPPSTPAKSSVAQPAATPANGQISPQPAAAAHPPRPRVGEPSPVVIQQQAANPKPR
jgi:hypothetical protein